MRPRSSCLAMACGEQPRNMPGPVCTRISRGAQTTRPRRREDSVQIGRWLTKTSTGHVAA